MIGLWTDGPFDNNLIQMDDYPANSCAISPTAFLLTVNLTCGYRVNGGQMCAKEIVLFLWR